MTVAPEDFPPVLPFSAPLTEPETGRSSSAFTKWLQFFRGQFVKAADDLQDQIVDLSTTVGDATAAIAAEAIVRASADTAEATLRAALSAQVNDASTGLPKTRADLISGSGTWATADTAIAATVTTAQATANGATASGAVYLVAKSAPAGYSARYGWELTASGNSVGMDAYVDNLGNGYIAFTASNFLFTDPSYNGGLPGNIWSYSGGVIHFGVPVEIRTGDMASDAASALGANTGTVGGGGSPSTVAVTVTVGGSGDVLVRMVLRTNGTGSRTGANLSQATHTYTITRDGGTAVGSATSFDHFIAVIGGSFTTVPGDVVAEFLVIGLSAGSHTFTAAMSDAHSMDCSLSVWNRKR